MPESPERSNSSASLIIGLAAAVILALGVGVLVYTRQPAPSSPVPAASAAAPSSLAAPSAVPEPTPEAPAAAPRAQPPAASQGSAPPSATSRSGGGKPSGGASPANKGKSAPVVASAKPEKAVPSAAPPLTAQAMQRRTFVASRTASESIRGISKSLSGFDSQRSKEVTVKRAPEIDGRIEFSASPAKVKPGDKYSVRVSLINEGKRTIEIKELEVSTAQNGKLSSSSVKPRARQVAPRQNEVIHEMSGTWDRNTTSFTVSVRVVSDRLDLYRNQLAWK